MSYGADFNNVAEELAKKGIDINEFNIVESPDPNEILPSIIEKASINMKAEKRLKSIIDKTIEHKALSRDEYDTLMRAYLTLDLGGHRDELIQLENITNIDYA